MLKNRILYKCKAIVNSIWTVETVNVINLGEILFNYRKYLKIKFREVYPEIDGGVQLMWEIRTARKVRNYRLNYVEISGGIMIAGFVYATTAHRARDATVGNEKLTAMRYRCASADSINRHARI